MQNQAQPENHSRLAAILAEYIGGQKQTDIAQAAGLPKATLNRWLHGKSVAPYYWDGLLQLLATLQLTRAQANRALRAAGIPTIDALYTSQLERAALLERWLVRAPNNLPAELTSFVGRDDEVIDLAIFLSQPSVRLVTLTGPGGSGKTRLALRAAAELLDAFPDGVFFVSLADSTDPTQLMPQVAMALGLADSTDATPEERITAWLTRRKMLLILDNLEQIIDCGPALVRLLQAAPGVTILTTSRVPLHVSGEHRRMVRPLPVPSPEAPIETLAANSAVELFVQRAQTVDHEFTLTPASAPDIATLCARLDGLPLAIELVAARTDSFTLADLVSRVPDVLSLAGDGPRDVAERQRALRATIAWSEQLLSSPAQRLFARLGILSGWNESLAISVASGPDLAADDIPTLLAALNDANLIEHFDDGPTSRYRMLATIREYALERLDATNERDATAERHARAMLALAEDAPPYVPKGSRAGWFERVDRERANFDAALIWAQTTGETLLLARLAAALWPYWLEYPLGRIGYHWVTTALADADDLPARVRAELLTGAAHFELTSNSHDLVYVHATEALAIWQEINDPVGQAHIFATLAWARITTDGPRTALILLEQQVEQWQAAGNDLGVATALSEMAVLHIVLGHFDTAAPYLQQYQEIAQRTGDALCQAQALHNLGLLALLQGDIDGALRNLGESVTRLEAERPTFLASDATLYLTTAQCLDGQLDTASAGYRDLLLLYERTGDLYHQSLAILGHAAVAHRRGQAEHAAWLCGVAMPLQHTSGLTPLPAVQAFYDREVQLLRAQITDEAFASAFARGAAVPPDEAVGVVLGRK
ncbi:MAG: tetratricopeptide repeat protein [Thermomicrobiales bacterium]|nr:tetratricopeptide repeat protein [Thermomicrobiales bacterium]